MRFTAAMTAAPRRKQGGGAPLKPVLHTLLLATGTTLALVVSVAVAVGTEEKQPPAPPPPPTAIQESPAPQTEAEAEAQSPAEAKEQADSQTAYADASPTEGRDLMKEKFDGQLENVSADPGRENAVRDFQQIVNPETAIIKADDGGSQLLSSSLPIAAPDESGKQVPVDLELTQQGSDYKPQNPLVDLRLPDSASGVMNLGDEGIGISLAGAKSSPATPLKGNLEYPDALPDTDLLLAPVTAGAELFAQVRSPKAPEQFTLDFNLPKGATLKQGEDGRIDIVSDGERLAAVLPAIATDAQGKNLDVAMDAKGESIVIGLAHRDQDVTYPILLDPVIDAYAWGTGAGPVGITDWQYASGTGSYQDQNAAYTHFYSCGIPSTCYQTYGAFVYGVNGNRYEHNTLGQYVYTVPGNSTFVYSAQLLALFSTRPSDPPNWFITYTGAYSSSNGVYIYPQGHSWFEEWGDGGVAHGEGRTPAIWNYTDTHELEPQQGYARRNDVDKIVAGLTTGGPAFNATAWRTFMLGGAVITLDDPEAPSFGSVSHTNLPNQNTWYGGTNPFSATASATATDDGLGVKSVSVRADMPGAAPKLVGTQTDSCIGNKSAPCPANKQVTLPYSSADLADGVSKLSLVGSDPLGSEDAGHETTPTPASQWQVKVDNTGPAIELSGSLAAATNGDLSEETYDLHVAATDGTTDPADPPEAHRSGVKNIKLFLDGSTTPLAASPDQSCPQDSCPQELDYTLNTSTLPGGDHTLKVVATDQLGNSKDKTLVLHSYEGAGTIISPKAGDSTARRFTLQAKRRNTSSTLAVFYFQRGTGPWQQIPVSNLTVGGQQPASTALAIDPATGKTPEVSWDVPSTPGIDQTDGPIKLLTAFYSSTAQVNSPVITVTLDRDTTTAKHASAPVGPGAVDLLTGNFTVSSDDVSVDSFGSDLTISRSFPSRQPALSPSGPLGPGWIFSTPVDAAGSDYTDLTVTSDLAKLTASDSTTITFAKNAAGEFLPEPGYEDLTLAAAGSGQYTLSDLDGNVTTFGQPPGTTGGAYKPVGVKQAGSQTATSVDYEPAPGGGSRTTRVIAPVPAGANCAVTASQVDRGCRVLTLNYAPSSTTPPQGAALGDYPNRLREITFTATNEAGSVVEIPVARYEYNAAGQLAAQWDPRVTPSALKTLYEYNPAGRINKITPPGESPWTISYLPAGAAPASDPSPGRLSKVDRAGPSGTATIGVAYGIPLTGSGTPYQMGSANVSAWAQTDLPTDATALIPADAYTGTNPPGSTELSRSTITYMNRNGDPVNVASPGGEISTTEYETHRQVRRQLTPANRALAMAAGGSSATLAAKLDTQNVYGANGLELREQFGPQHQVKLSDTQGALVNARQHTTTVFDQGAPAIQHPHLPTTTTEGIRVEGESVDRPAEDWVSTTGYNWKLRTPTSSTTDPGGLSITSRSSYNSSTGLPNETRTPKAGASGDSAHVTKTIYYEAGASADPDCSSRPEWANLPCKVMPAAQPGGSAPNIPVTRFTSYNIWNQPTAQTETVPGSGEQRTTTTAYDSAGRTVTQAITGTGSNVGSALPPVATAYSPTTGRPVAVSSSVGTITQAYDVIGRSTSNADADGNSSMVSYDILDRPVGSSDGKGTTSFTYDATTRRLTGLNTSGVGNITATYDADGRVISESLPSTTNTLSVAMAYDPAGNQTSKAYKSCFLGLCGLGQTTLYSDAALYSSHNQIKQETTSTSSQAYSYDAAGRLTVASKTVSSQCTTRRYSFDQNSNRTASANVPPLSGGACDTVGTGQSRSHSYDAADRLTDAGYTYDPFGRTTAVPAADAGANALSAFYYLDDRVRSLTQGSVTQAFDLDPAGRVRVQSTTGQPDQRFHYSDSSDNPSWIDRGGSQSNWIRFASDPAGILAATQTGHGATSDGFTFQLTNIHGDVVATANASAGVTQRYDADEFGVPSGAVPADGHGWLGGKERRTQLASGVITMGQRVYVPQTGRFLQTDPVVGGSANDYDCANQDPINQSDILGTRARRLSAPAPRFHSRPRPHGYRGNDSPRYRAENKGQTYKTAFKTREKFYKGLYRWCGTGQAIDFTEGPSDYPGKAYIAVFFGWQGNKRHQPYRHFYAVYDCYIAGSPFGLYTQCDDAPHVIDVTC